MKLHKYKKNSERRQRNHMYVKACQAGNRYMKRLRRKRGELTVSETVNNMMRDFYQCIDAVITNLNLIR